MSGGDLDILKLNILTALGHTKIPPLCEWKIRLFSELLYFKFKIFCVKTPNHDKMVLKYKNRNIKKTLLSCSLFILWVLQKNLFNKVVFVSQNFFLLPYLYFDGVVVVTDLVQHYNVPISLLI